MGKENGTYTEIRLAGSRAGEYLLKNGVEIAPGSNGYFVVGTSSGSEIDTPFGTVGVEHGSVELASGSALEVRLDCSDARLLRSRHSQKPTRTVSVNNEGYGSQRFGKGVVIIVSTNVPRAVFENNKR
jgi:hypothetical protein